MNFYLLKDYIGLFAPIILFILSGLLLRNMKIYLQYFIYGFFLNNILNILLKLTIKQPRPSKDEKSIEIAVANDVRVGFDHFGMPSGHAQNCSYCLTFITLVLNEPFITGFYAILTANSLIQRYLYNNHTFLQLIIGFMIGIGFGYATYLFGNKTIVGNIATKKDDNALL